MHTMTTSTYLLRTLTALSSCKHSSTIAESIVAVHEENSSEIWVELSKLLGNHNLIMGEIAIVYSLHVPLIKFLLKFCLFEIIKHFKCFTIAITYFPIPLLWFSIVHLVRLSPWKFNAENLFSMLLSGGRN